jgi:hypothetical protein
MTKQVLCEVSLNPVTLFPEDVIVNTFAFEIDAADDITDVDIDGLDAAIHEFYTANIGGTGRSVESYFGAQLANSRDNRWYDISGHLSGTPHGSPIRSIHHGRVVGPSNAGSLPAECAAVITLRGDGWQDAAVEAADGADADTLRDRPRKRRSGRVYIGPLNISAVGQAAGSEDVRLTEAFRGDLLVAAARLQASAADLAVPHYWSVWSRKDAALYPVVQVEADNAVDIVRGRGRKATIRSGLFAGTLVP